MSQAFCRAALLSLAMGAPLLALAETPSPPRTHARYGPLTQCLDGYALSAGASEAISVAENDIAVTNDRFGMSLNRESGDPDRSRAQASEIEIESLGRVTRYENVRYGSALIRAEYLLPARFGSAPLVVRSHQFDGSERDLAMLGRVSRVEPQNQACLVFAAPDFHGEDVDALYWSPFTVAGPVYRCQNGIGYRVRAGEAIQLQWRLVMPWTIPLSRVTSDGTRLTWDGPITYRNASTSVPLSRYRRSVGLWSGRWILSLSPPQAQMSRAELNRLPRERRYGDGVQIEFPAGKEAAARAFATRLEFVDIADPRCLSD